ncbi:putative IclR family transcriptional regulator [Gordonia namibiensis NBRC 108229]|uniref:Putative IclR family transcriptional regulator n=1 Tax=Gordonia namibiensis NBRC 108229 TaxID=1208314 RepID=K6X423_9ACTN|nr:helix-turn-helix domain-containing protein [Gordonia namibiensis]GAB99137.1 putative IclR family transcriptional regulator [Gordonia namibiensis NBRC 108229]
MTTLADPAPISCDRPVTPVNDAAPTAVLDRLSLVLEAFAGRETLSLAEVVVRTGVPRSSAHRMLDRLVAMRWLRRQGRDYSLGIRLVELGSLAVHQDRVHSASADHLHHLYRITGMVVHLAVLDGDDIVYLDKIGGRLAAHVPTRVGGRLPAERTALGNALLAFNGRNLPGDALVRERGFATHRDGALRGFGCIAAPIGPAGEATTAVSICGPLRDMAFDHRMTSPVQLAAGAIWRSLSAGVRVTPTLQRRDLLRSLPTAASVLSEG